MYYLRGSGAGFSNGRKYLPRGPDSLARYGPTYATATQQQRQSRVLDKMVGRGLYTGGRGGYWMQKLFGATPGGWLDKLGDTAASIIPGASNIAQGSRALYEGGRTLAGAMSGRGAYVANDLVAGVGDGIIKPAGASDDDAITVANTEYLSDVYGPASLSFANQTYALNPAIEKTFPWLSQIAANYQEFEFVQLLFQFKPITSIFAPSNGQVGTIAIATQYNPTDAPFTSERDFEDVAHSVSAKITDELVAGVECDPRKNAGSERKFTRVGPPPPGADLNSYDQGTLNVAVGGIPAAYANQRLGKLYVSYTVVLRKKKRFSSEGFAISRDTFLWQKQPVVFPPTVAAVSTPNDLVMGQQNNIGVVTVWDTNGLNLVFPSSASGQYKIRLKCETDGLLMGTPLLQATWGNVAAINDLFDPINNTWKPDMASVGPSGATCVIYELHVRLDNPALIQPPHDNQVRIYWPTASTGSGNASTTVDIEEYNTMFNRTPQGPLDAVVYVDPTTKVQVPL